MPKVAIIGTGRWGRTLALMLAQNGLNVSLWARTEPEAQTLISSGLDSDGIATLPLPSNLSVTSSLAEAVSRARMVLLVVPSQTMRRNIRLVNPYL